jgi:hypothetical protein
MSFVAVLASVALAQSVGGQQFAGPVTYYDVEYGSTLVLDGDHWEFRIIGRKGFLRMLSEIHGRGFYNYEVGWGEVDTLRIEFQHLPAANGVSAFDVTLRHALNAVAMTYRVEGGIYNICPRPIPQDYGLMGPDESHLGKRSLDTLALWLSERSTGYRVERARSAVVGLTAPFVSLRSMLWIIGELDPMLDIETRHGIVVRSRYYYR